MPIFRQTRVSKLRVRLLPEANLRIDLLRELAEVGHDIALARVFPIPQAT